MKNVINMTALSTALILGAGAYLMSKDVNVFSHKPHLDGGIECENCHKDIKSSTVTAGGRDMPSRKICNECHDEKDGYSQTIKFTYKQIYKFNHKLHVVDQGLSCKECHEALYKKKFVTQEEIVPKMEYCFQCHDNSTATQYCMMCHVNSTKPDDHRKNWDKLHGKKANSRAKECQQCHTSKEFCLRCHKEKIAIPRYHNPNYEMMHRNESRISLKNCRACHSDRQCRDCHKIRGVDYKITNLKKRHPLGWTNRLSSNFHAKKARLNLASCTTCHTKNECNYCHFSKRRR
jgi:c(7)-type cytochrome triheme protein